jgi:hypothetical protein
MRNSFRSYKWSIIAGIAMLAAFSGANTARAQGAMTHNRVIVNLPYAVAVGDTVLQPGNYLLQEITQRTIQFINTDDPDGPKVEATYTSIAAEKNETPETSSVVLGKMDNDYFLDRMWIQGQNTGYEFTLPERIKSRVKERGTGESIAVTYDRDGNTTR